MIDSQLWMIHWRRRRFLSRGTGRSQVNESQENTTRCASSMQSQNFLPSHATFSFSYLQWFIRAIENRTFQYRNNSISLSDNYLPALQLAIIRHNRVISIGEISLPFFLITISDIFRSIFLTIHTLLIITRKIFQKIFRLQV